MKYGIVFLTYEDSEFDVEMYRSICKISIPYKIAINKTNDSKYEMLAIKCGMDNYDEFIVIQDSCKIKDQQILLDMLAIKGSVWLSSWGQNYFCKYRTEILKKMTLPEIKSKADSVRYEREFHEQYKLHETPIVLMDGCLENTNEFEYAFGRNNMISENKYFKKYKGTWDISQVPTNQ